MGRSHGLPVVDETEELGRIELALSQLRRALALRDAHKEHLTMGKKQTKQTFTDREIADARSGGVQQFDGRKRLRHVAEGDELSGKWNTHKPQSVVVSRDNIRKVE